MLSFTVLPDILISFLFFFSRFYWLYAVFVMVVLPFGVIKNNNNKQKLVGPHFGATFPHAPSRDLRPWNPEASLKVLLHRWDETSSLVLTMWNRLKFWPVLIMLSTMWPTRTNTLGFKCQRLKVTSPVSVPQAHLWNFGSSSVLKHINQLALSLVERIRPPKI